MSDLLPIKAETWHSGQSLQYPNGDPAQGPGSAPHNKRVLSFLRHYWWVPVVSTTFAAAAAIAFLLLASPVYVSTAQMWETEKMRLPAEGAAFTEDLQNYLGTQMELLRSDKLQSMTLQRLRDRGTAIPRDRRGKPPKVRIRVSQAPKTAVLEAEAFCSNPGYARVFLNALMDEYLEYKKIVRKSVSGDTAASISDQALRLEQELKASQDALMAFERTNNLAILEEEGRIAGGHLATLKTQLSDLKLQAQLLEATALERDVAAVGKTNLTGLLTTLPGANASASSAFIAERQAAVRELEVLKMQRAQLSKYMRPRHPKIVKLDADIDRAQKLVEMYQHQSQEELAASRQALKMSFDSVGASIKEWEAKVVEANNRIAEAERLKLNVTRTQTLYDRLTLLLQNVDVSRSVDRETLAILESASPAERYYLRDLLILAIALATGCGGGVGLVLLQEIRDDRFASVLEVDDRFGESVLGQLPEISRLARNGPIALVENESQQDMFAESCRNLRSALLFLAYEGQRPKTILITSALPNEGKSTVAANLAKALALGGSRVLLVDGDLRKGQLHRVLGLQAKPGLVDLLAHGNGRQQVMQTDSNRNLVFISRGSSTARPGDLLLKPELDEILARWREEFDYVLIDSCPVFAADDVTTLAHKADGTLVIVRRQFAGARIVTEALAVLLRRQARVLGLVFNRADSSANTYHYYKYGEYHAGTVQE